ncbi:MAG TPA: 50S ribosomal protein L24 [Elusimicrobiota bacterium]|nr:50S ribosomal protein L24 [Elusimicrobiota bacterium]
MALATVRKKDKVRILAGKDRGKEGEVLDVDLAGRRVLVAKLNLVKRHTKGTPQNPGGVKEQEAFLPMSKVMLVCPKCKRTARPKAGALSDGTKARVCRHCGEMIG